jgi:hypothetical protein
MSDSKIGSAEIDSIEIRFFEVCVSIEVFSSPSIPGFDTPFQNGQLLCVCHEFSLSNTGPDCSSML